MAAVGETNTKSSVQNLTNASHSQRPNFMGSIFRDSFSFYRTKKLTNYENSIRKINT